MSFGKLTFDPLGKTSYCSQVYLEMLLRYLGLGQIDVYTCQAWKNGGLTGCRECKSWHAGWRV